MNWTWINIHPIAPNIIKGTLHWRFLQWNLSNWRPKDFSLRCVVVGQKCKATATTLVIDGKIQWKPATSHKSRNHSTTIQCLTMLHFLNCASWEEQGSYELTKAQQGSLILSKWATKRDDWISWSSLQETNCVFIGSSQNFMRLQGSKMRCEWSWVGHTQRRAALIDILR